MSIIRDKFRLECRRSIAGLNLLLLLACAFITSCGTTSVPNGIQPVQGFDLQRYLGTWYEIARLDHSFERNLGDVSATYTLNDDGTVKVLNSGIYVEPSKKAGKRNSATGKAKFVGDRQTGHLKVSFFGPFYGSYVVFELDEDGYQYALVAGPSRKFLWMLARQPKIEEALYQRLLEVARNNGYDTDKLIRVEQSG